MSNHPISAALLSISSEPELILKALELEMITDINALETEGGERVFRDLMRRWRMQTNPQALEAIERLLNLKPDLRDTKADTTQSGNFRGDLLDLALRASSPQVAELLFKAAEMEHLQEILQRKSGHTFTREHEELPWAHALAMEGRSETLKILQECGVDVVNCKDHKGRTAMFVAGKHAISLVDAGFDPFATDAQGRVAYQVAMDQMRSEYNAAALLEDFNKKLAEVGGGQQTAIQEAYLRLINANTQSTMRWSSSITNEQLEKVPNIGELPPICKWSINSPKLGKMKGPYAVALGLLNQATMHLGNLPRLLTEFGMLPEQDDKESWAMVTLLAFAQRQGEVVQSYNNGWGDSGKGKLEMIEEKRHQALEILAKAAPPGWPRSDDWIETIGKVTQEALRLNPGADATRLITGAWKTLLYRDLSPATPKVTTSKGSSHLPRLYFNGSLSQTAPLTAGKSLEERFDLLLKLARVSDVMIGDFVKATEVIEYMAENHPQRSGEIALLASFTARRQEIPAAAQAAYNKLESIDIKNLSKREQQLVARQLGAIDKIGYQQKVMQAMVSSTANASRKRM